MLAWDNCGQTGIRAAAPHCALLREDESMSGFKRMRLWERGLRLLRRGNDFGFPGYGPAMWWDIPAARSYATLEEELTDLKCRAQMLTQELETIQKRIAQLEKSTDFTLDG
jgi:hypothetical protein